MTALEKPTELLTAEPAAPTGIRIGYARVFTGGQPPGLAMTGYATSGGARTHRQVATVADHTRRSPGDLLHSLAHDID